MEKMDNGRILIAESRTNDRMREDWKEVKVYEDQSVLGAFYVVTVGTGTDYSDVLGASFEYEYDTMAEALQCLADESGNVSTICGTAANLAEGVR